MANAGGGAEDMVKVVVYVVGVGVCRPQDGKRKDKDSLTDAVLTGSYTWILTLLVVELRL